MNQSFFKQFFVIHVIFPYIIVRAHLNTNQMVCLFLYDYLNLGWTFDPINHKISLVFFRVDCYFLKFY